MFILRSVSSTKLHHSVPLGQGCVSRALLYIRCLVQGTADVSHSVISVSEDMPWSAGEGSSRHMCIQLAMEDDQAEAVVDGMEL